MIKDENFIQISAWMVNQLNLKGNELLIYGLIYGFSGINFPTKHNAIQKGIIIHL